jgi:hypothetical protein
MSWLTNCINRRTEETVMRMSSGGCLMMQMSNPLEGGSRRNSVGKHTEKIKSLILHITPSKKCANFDGIAQRLSTITGDTSPLYINDAGDAPLESPQSPRRFEGVVQK